MERGLHRDPYPNHSNGVEVIHILFPSFNPARNLEEISFTFGTPCLKIMVTELEGVIEVIGGGVH